MKQLILILSLIVFSTSHSLSQELVDVGAGVIDFLLRNPKTANKMNATESAALDIIGDLLKTESKRNHQLKYATAGKGQVTINSNDGRQAEIVKDSHGSIYLLVDGTIYPINKTIANQAKEQEDNLVIEDNSLSITSVSTSDNRTVFISPDGNYIISGCDNKRGITLWNSNGQVLWRDLLPENVELESAAISKNGDIIVIGGQRDVMLIKNKEGDNLWQKEIKGELQVATTFDGSKIYVAGNLGDLYCFSKEGEIVFQKKINTRNWGVWSLSITSNGQYIMLKTNSDIIILNEKGEELYFFDIVEGNSLVDAVLSNNGNKFVVSFAINEEYFVSLYDIRHGLIWKNKTNKWAQLAIDVNDYVYASGIEGSIYVWNDNGVLVKIIDNDGSVSLDISDSGKILTTGNWRTFKIFTINRIK